MTWIGKNDPNVRREPVIERLKNSQSGYVLVKRFVRDRAALKLLMDEGRVKRIKTPFGNAYKLINGGTPDECAA